MQGLDLKPLSDLCRFFILQYLNKFDSKKYKVLTLLVVLSEQMTKLLSKFNQMLTK